MFVHYMIVNYSVRMKWIRVVSVAYGYDETHQAKR